MSSIGGVAIDQENDEGGDKSKNAEGRYKNQRPTEIRRTRWYVMISSRRIT